MKISQDKVDFWKLHESGKLELMQERELYPPRIKLKIAEAPPTAEVIKVTFRGTRESEEEMMIALTIPSTIGDVFNICTISHKYYTSFNSLLYIMIEKFTVGDLSYVVFCTSLPLKGREAKWSNPK